MLLVVKNKLVSIGGDSTIEDADGNPVFKVKGEVFTFTQKKRIYDLEGKLLFTVRNKFWKLFMNSAYIYDANGKKIARLKNRFSFKSIFTSDGYEESFRVTRNEFGKGFTIYKNEEAIAIWGGNATGELKQARKENFFNITDTFIVSYDNPENAPILAALIIAIDNIRDNNSADARD